MATAGVSGVSGAAELQSLSADQLRRYLLTWGVDADRVQQHSQRLAQIGVTLKGLAAVPLDVLLSLLIGKGVPSTKGDDYDAYVIMAGAREAAAAAAGVSAYSVLAENYTRISFCGISESSTLAKGARTPTTIYRWRVSMDQLQQELRHLHDIHMQRTVYQEQQYMFTAEETCRSFFDTHVLYPVNKVLAAERRSVRYIMPGTHTPQGGAPDFSADEMVDGQNIGVLVVGEYKTRTELGHVTDNLTDTINVANLRKAMQQVWGYVMDAAGDPDAGFFGSTDRVWFFRADRTSNTMYVTDAVHCDAPPSTSTPSVRQMLYLLLRLRGKPLPTDAVQWAQTDIDRIFYQENQQGGGLQAGGQQGDRLQGGGLHGGGQQGGGLQGGGWQGGGQQGGSQEPVASQRVAIALVSHNIVPNEEFQDLRTIGNGESGPVSAAWLHGRRVAVKFGDCYNRKEVVRHMFNEVATYEALQPLQGTFIPRLEEHGYTMWGGSFFVATQLINGRTHEEGDEVTTAQKLAAEQALAAIHAAGYLHGDVRGDNLMFEEETGKAFFLDLGYSLKGSCAEEFQAEMRELQELLVPIPTRDHS